MAHLIQISLPDETYKVLKEMAETNNCTINEFATQAVKRYIHKNQHIFSELKQGYIDMGDINLEFAEEFLGTDNEMLLQYEEKLSESE